mmetsp:Transcript_28426/g.71220  ORF Transcript_28426/g.71220 Transcript_28426/m.71220 type:complete len:314 (-) Transcript_28426:759-1700(-)
MALRHGHVCALYSAHFILHWSNLHGCDTLCSCSKVAVSAARPRVECAPSGLAASACQCSGVLRPQRLCHPQGWPRHARVAVARLGFPAPPHHLIALLAMEHGGGVRGEGQARGSCLAYSGLDAAMHRLPHCVGHLEEVPTEAGTQQCAQDVAQRQQPPATIVWHFHGSHLPALLPDSPPLAADGAKVAAVGHHHVEGAQRQPRRQRHRLVERQHLRGVIDELRQHAAVVQLHHRRVVRAVLVQRHGGGVTRRGGLVVHPRVAVLDAVVGPVGAATGQKVLHLAAVAVTACCVAQQMTLAAPGHLSHSCPRVVH